MMMKAEMPSEITRSRTQPASTGARIPVGLAGESLRGAISGAGMYSLILYGVGLRWARLLAGGGSGDRAIYDGSGDRAIYDGSGDRAIGSSGHLKDTVLGAVACEARSAALVE